ncbi:MAG: DUF1002 domain-containing protein [Lachnospiraceae bacterium]|nr:DUF1002 domain-containing protein [Lachnospiraceae bacterium]
MNGKRLTGILLGLVLALSLTACGGSAEDLYEVDMDALLEADEPPAGMDAETFEAYKREAAAKKEAESVSAETDKTDAGEKDDPVSASEGEAEREAEQLYLALGNDLTEPQLGTVLQLMDVSQEVYDGADVVYVTNEEEHTFLDPYIDPSRIGKNALSSVLVRPREEGYGVEVTTKNINFCSPEMYQNAFMTAGVKNADIIVAGPFDISGTAALIGAVKAYEKLSGISISDTVVDVAIDELITTGELAEAVGSKEDAAKLVSVIKARVIAERPTSREELESLIREILKELGLNLSDEYIDRIVELILKLMRSGIDLDGLSGNAP